MLIISMFKVILLNYLIFLDIVFIQNLIQISLK